MTCIAGVVTHDNVVYIGGDSAAISNWNMTVRAVAKVFYNGPMLFGYTTSFRMGQLLQYALVIPEQKPTQSIYEWLVTTFLDAVREGLKEGGYALKEKEQESAGQFLVGYRNHLFEIDDDYQVNETLGNMAAIGCGAPYALGSLYSTTTYTELSPHSRIFEALRVAQHFSAGVREPFHILRLPREEA